MTLTAVAQVWTGTTYALAATMLHEALGLENPNLARCAARVNSPLSPGTCSSDRELTEPLLSPALSSHISDTEEDLNRPLNRAERSELIEMSHNTARGIHDAGWQRFGYWFATPEAWEKSGEGVTSPYFY